MAAGTYNFTIEQGVTFTLSLTYTDPSDTPIDLTGFSARMMLKKSVSTRNALIDASTDNGKITLGGSAGTVDIFISAAETAELPVVTGVYDLELTSGSAVSRLIQGTFTVSAGVTA